jgi:hypothetical protein
VALNIKPEARPSISTGIQTNAPAPDVKVKELDDKFFSNLESAAKQSLDAQGQPQLKNVDAQVEPVSQVIHKPTRDSSPKRGRSTSVADNAGVKGQMKLVDYRRGRKKQKETITDKSLREGHVRVKKAVKNAEDATESWGPKDEKNLIAALHREWDILKQMQAAKAIGPDEKTWGDTYSKEVRKLMDFGNKMGVETEGLEWYKEEINIIDGFKSIIQNAPPSKPSKGLNVSPELSPTAASGGFVPLN